MARKAYKRSGEFNLLPRKEGPFRFWLWWVRIKT